MAADSAIEWTHATWSPVTGCTKVSAGCKNCYAEREVQTRWSKNPKSVWFGRKFTDVQCHRDKLDQPLHWRKGRRIFVCPRADLFHESVPDEFIDQVFAVMASCPWHTFQVLTKRPARMLAWFIDKWQPAPEWSQRELHERFQACVRESGVSMPLPEFRLDTEGEDRFDQVHAAYEGMTLWDIFNADRFWTADGTSHINVNPWPLPNVWIGVSVEDQATADERIPLLLQTPAAVRWISAEPLLGPIDLNFLWSRQVGRSAIGQRTKYRKLDWVVAGGESGPNARPSHPQWFRSLRDQCKAAAVPYFFKQWGEWGRPIGPIYSDDDTPEHLAALECDDEGPKECHVTPSGGQWISRLCGQPPPGTWAMQKIGKRAAGRRLDGVEHSEFPA